MSVDSQPTFNKYRSFIWPIQGSELRKLIPMLLMVFFIAFNYNILRSLKDSLLVTAKASGAEVIPFVKVWAIIPMVLFVTSLFIKLSHRYSTEKVFYIVMGGFLVFFSTFTFILYPLRDVIHPHATAEFLTAYLPSGFMGFIAMLRYWSFSLFYCMAELWGTTCLAILFWGFANEVTKVNEAKRFYGVLGVGANISAIVSGKVSYHLASRLYNPNWIIGTDRLHQSLILLTIAVVGAGIAAIAVFYWFNRNVVSVGHHTAAETNKKVSKLEARPSMKENFAYLLRSSYLTRLGIILFVYNICIVVVEVLWKDQVKQLCPDSNDYMAYMSQVTFVTGIVATAMALLVSANVVRRFGWTVTALVTPVTLIVTSIGIFAFYLFPKEGLTTLTAALGTTPVAMVAFFGSAQNVLSRGCKYSVFDATKELAYIPLSRECRVRGKAAIEGVCSRVGKSGASVFYQGLLVAFQTVGACAPYIAAVLAVALTSWVWAVKSLGKKFNAITQPETAPPEPDRTVVGEPAQQVV